MLVNAGPTYETIDPIRYIGNFSSGKMGVAIAMAAEKCGADVHLIAGPGVSLSQNSRIEVTNVVSAAQMAEACQKAFEGADVAVLAAAVADFTPEKSNSRKVKRGDNDLVLRLKPTRDIAAMLGRAKRPGQIVVGFALETDNEVANATDKLNRKNLDFIVLNSLCDEGAGFGGDSNKITIIDKNNKIDNFELKPKSEVALDIIHKITLLIKNTEG